MAPFFRTNQHEFNSKKIDGYNTTAARYSRGEDNSDHTTTNFVNTPNQGNLQTLPATPITISTLILVEFDESVILLVRAVVAPW